MKRRNGFSLVETLIAAAVLSTSLLAMSSALTAAAQAMHDADRRYAVAGVAEDLLIPTWLPGIVYRPLGPSSLSVGPVQGRTQRLAWTVTIDGREDRFETARHVR